MAGTDEVDDNRLIGRVPRAPRRDPIDDAPAVDGDADAADDETPDQEIEAVNRLMGFLRGDDEG